MTRTLLTILIAIAVAETAHAEPAAYAIVVGSNAGGDGQQPLQFAETDARHVAQLLTELGGYDPSRVFLVLAPAPGDLLATIDKVAGSVRADAAAGRQSALFFYYSGHARAHALNLGPIELPLEQLRQRLLQLPTTLTIVVLDACQSGAFSRVKGVEPSADFSFNSVRRLNAAGVAVMASSSATELSQESAELGASYFTHHLLVGLRGAGDSNIDGRVSLDEAYRYAYEQTLIATSTTAVGAQHVTLETDLKGKGDIPLTYPERADAHLEIPATLTGTLLLRHRTGGSVVAEVTKAPGAVYRLALPAGHYQAIIRTGNVAHDCQLELPKSGTLRLDLSHCRTRQLDSGASKGLVIRRPPAPRWSLELGAGLALRRTDRYTERLEEFGFREQIKFFPKSQLSLTAGYRVHEHLAVVADLRSLTAGDYSRDSGVDGQYFRWHTAGLGLHLRGSYDLANGLLTPFAQAGAGLARGTTTMSEGGTDGPTDSYWGYQLALAAGVQLTPTPRFSFFGQASFIHAPVIENLLGDVHDSGGLFFTAGVIGRL